jgi:hypothetical protein
MEHNGWQVGTTRYRLNTELFDSSRVIQVKRINAFDKAITSARLRRAVVEFGGNISAEMTENLIGIRATSIKTLEEALEALDELLSTLDRIVTSREAGVSAEHPRLANIARSRAKKAASRSGFVNSPQMAHTRH